ncbi:MAG: bifunctional riboflavin kinase/FAD synthetase [Gemmatimonadetes bacterium]|nr:MAG: bifunctional riboflavin kinase/FAD synthetase [Gemmatimonadota bacterium]
MKIITVDHRPHDPRTRLPAETVTTIGMFDGVHTAHQAILRKMVTTAQQHRRLSVVITFSPHPLRVIAPERAPQLLTVDVEKFRVMEQLGIDVLVVADFQPEFAQMLPDDFIRHMLLDFMTTRHVLVGYDHGFGKNRSGDTNLLKAIGRMNGFTVEIVEPIIQADGMRVGSTPLRQAVLAGEWETVQNMLGRRYELTGTVVHGDHRGHDLGFPTANLDLPPEKLLPPDGVYAVYVELEGCRHKGVMNVGTRPTFEETKRQVEVHLLDNHQMLYGKTLRVEIEAFLRPEQRFASTENLQYQIKNDIARTREILTE